MRVMMLEGRVVEPVTSIGRRTIKLDGTLFDHFLILHAHISHSYCLE